MSNQLLPVQPVADAYMKMATELDPRRYVLQKAVRRTLVRVRIAHEEKLATLQREKSQE